jgi:glycosyltransferase involved in cell wall biosynthesis
MVNPVYSIIIPHYDIPDLLMRCLKSIPISEDIQVIVVDDNSPDADTYLERYPELSRPYLEFILTTKGGGAGYARNVGLDHAKGKWLLFADADDLYVDNMYEIIQSYIDSEADVIYFKEKSVLSSDIDKTIKRVQYLNEYIDQYFETGYEKYVRLRYCSPWGKMIKREFVENHHFRFDEVEYSNDYYFSVCTGYYAKKIEVADQILYIYTYRENSLTGKFCSTPHEFKVRAEVSFRVEKMFKQLNVDIEQQKPFKWYLQRMLRQDRDLFRYYFFKLPEIYPSIPTAIRSHCSGKRIRFTIKMYLYSLWLWLTRFSDFE